MEITINALRERIRRKEIYVVILIAGVILLLCGSGAATLTIDGESITGFNNMIPVLNTVVNVTGCFLALVLSLGTIPAEYEQRKSHLVWIRGISQRAYHIRLAAANLLSSIAAVLVLYGSIAVYLVINQKGGYLIRLIPAFLCICMNVAIVSFLTSALSIKLPRFINGMLGIIVVLAGVFHGLIDLYRSVAGGTAGAFLRGLLWITPDLNGIQKLSANIILGAKPDWHVILTGILWIYIVFTGLMIFKRKEA